MSDGAVIAARILENDGEPFATLSLANGLPPVTISTAVADARRNYMRLAALIHPDKIKGEFEKSTEAFQCLVKAFETFVDPKLRKRAAAVFEKSKKQSIGEVKATPDKKQKGKIDKLKRKAKRKVAASEKTEIAKHDKSAEVVKRKKKTKEEQQQEGEEEEDEDDDFVEKDSEEEEESDEDEDEDESQAGEEGEDWEDKFLADDIEPAVSTSRTPIGIARVGGVYTQTIIGCPNCRTRWEPDSKPQYSLFMGKWGKKVHCQLCLFVFGSASALHNCPHCNTAFDYDASMYDSTITCVGCKREIGFPYYPVNQMLIDNLALEQWRARKEAEKIKERELRARQRHGLGATDHNTFKSSNSKGNNKSSSSHKSQRAAENEEEMLTLVGTCVVEDECPLCHQRIKRNHRTHVEECIKLTLEQRKEAKQTRKATVNDNISGNQQNSKKEMVPSTRKRARPSTTQTKEAEDSVNDINAKNTKGKAKQPAKVPSSSTSSSSAAKGSKSGNKQRNSRQHRRGKRNHSDDDDDDDDESEEESFGEDDSEDNDESDEEDEFTESDDEDDDEDDDNE